MGRKQKEQPLLIVVFKLAALVPWWAGVLAALATFLVLHWASGLSPVAIEMTRTSAGIPIPKSLVTPMVSMFLIGLAKAGQYLVPPMLLAGACASFFARTKREVLFEQSAAPAGPAAFGNMLWGEFEQLVGESFRREGFAVQETGGGGADGGVDLRLRRDGQTYLVQCKHWKVYKVGVSVVREMYGLVAAERAAGGYVITSGSFTQEAARFAEGKALTLVDGPALQQMLAAAAAARHASAAIRRASTPVAPVTGPRAVTINAAALVTPADKLSTSKLAAKNGLSTKEALVRLQSAGLLEMRGDRHSLTSAGRAAGGEWRPGHGGYFIWPADTSIT